MLFDLRIYRCGPCTMLRQRALHAKAGYAAQCRHLGAPLFYGTVETGDVKSYVHLWAYDRAADRKARRSALYADPVWREYRERGAFSQPAARN